MYSEDGINWTTVASADDRNGWFGVAYGNGRFVAVGGKYGGGDVRLMYSDDGINWSLGNPPLSNKNWLGVAYGAGKFVAIANSNKLAYSEDGINWSNTGLTGSSDWRGITYGNGYFVTVGTSGYSRVAWSKDGITWMALSDQTNKSSWWSVTYGAGKFVAVARDRTNKVMVLDAPEGSDASGLYFNDDPVVLEKGQTRGLATSISSLSSRFGTPRYYTSEEPSDSFGIENGTLWLNPSNAKLSIYNDSDWNQLN